MSVQMNIKWQPAIRRGNITIDAQCCAVWVAGEEIDLYPKEFDVLHLLMQYPGWVLSPEQIYGTVWQGDMAGCEYVVYNVICQLRRKLKNPDVIQTMVGRGYRFAGVKYHGAV